MNIVMIEQIKDEFNRLRQQREVMEDGILDLNRYCNAPIRILWILKQAPHYGEYNLSEWLGRVVAEDHDFIPGSPTWRRMALVSAGLLRKVSFEEVKKFSRSELADCLMSTAIIEIQKELGDLRTTAVTLFDGYQKYGDLIKRQIKAYAPDVIIVGMGEEWMRKAIVEDLFSSCSNGVLFAVNGENGGCNFNLREEQADVAFVRAGTLSFLWTTHPQYSIGISDRAYFNTLCQAWLKSLELIVP